MPGRQRIEARGSQGREGWDEFQGERILGARPEDGNSREGPTPSGPGLWVIKHPRVGDGRGWCPQGRTGFHQSKKRRD